MIKKLILYRLISFETKLLRLNQPEVQKKVVPVVLDNLPDISCLAAFTYKDLIRICISSHNSHNKHFHTHQTILQRIHDSIFIKPLISLIKIIKYFFSEIRKHYFLPESEKEGDFDGKEFH